MELTTDKGKTFRAAWAEAPTPLLGQMIIEIYDERRIGEIAADFDGVQRVSVTSEYGTREFSGYTELIKVARNTSTGTAQLSFERPKE